LPHVLHVITALPVGGAQSQLYELARHRTALGVDMSVVSLAERGPMGERLAALGVAVEGLGMRPARLEPGSCWRLARLIRRRRPDAVQTWLYHADLVGGLAARAAGVPRVYWNIRQTDLSSAACRWGTRAVARACAWLSASLPDAIVCNSQAALGVHAAFGYASGRLCLIDNGVDLERFRPDPDAGARLRQSLALPAGSRLIGLAARYHPHKDHAGFLAAAAAVARARADAVFVLCGEDVDEGNAALAALIARHDLARRVRLLGSRTDMPGLLAAFDLAVSASFSEGSPNALIEAMAAGTPCVATDVGDCARVLGDTGWLAPAQDPPALAAALLSALAVPTAERARRGAAARRRAEDRFAIDAMLRAYARLYAGYPALATPTPTASTSRP